MGSLKSSPLPTYKPAPVVVVSTPDAVVDEVSDSVDVEKATNIVRRASRGRGSTIKTSFRGVLGANNALAPQRKNLLGE